MGELFLSGNGFLSYPLRIVWKIFEDLTFEVPAQAGFSVPKKLFKRAVDRNRMKRLIRESYRLHKSALYAALNQSDKHIAVMMIYIAKEELPFSKIEPATIKAIEKIVRQLTKDI
jgi:ribonuclease P protein component